MTAEEYLKKSSLPVSKQEDDILSVSVSNAHIAVELARKEEREKAIKVFREMTCKMGIDIPCERCSSTCAIYKFKELLDKE